MHLKSLLLRNFRNYQEEQVLFAPGVNWILGGNGEGKTSLLEAVHILSTGRSFRTHLLSDIILFGAKFFYLEGVFEKEGVEHILKVYYDEKTRRVQYNETAYSTFTSLLGILPFVLLSPNDLSLISGPSSERRKFIDLHISQTDPLYLHHLGRYFKALKQRNILLKQEPEETIEAWEQIMAESAEIVMRKRKETLAALQPVASQWINNLSSGKEGLSLEYAPSFLKTGKEETAQKFSYYWKTNREKERMIGTTTIGPHRDDLLFSLNNQILRQFSSEGQKRSCVCALRFSQSSHLFPIIGTPPLFGIDDFGIQLDKTRQSHLIAQLSSDMQIFLTAPFSPTCLDEKHSQLFIHSGTAKPKVHS